MVNMASSSATSKKNQKILESSVNFDHTNSANRNSVMIDEYSDEDEDFQIADVEQEVTFIPLKEELGHLCSFKSK